MICTSMPENRSTSFTIVLDKRKPLSTRETFTFAISSRRVLHDSIMSWSERIVRFASSFFCIFDIAASRPCLNLLVSSMVVIIIVKRFGRLSSSRMSWNRWHMLFSVDNLFLICRDIDLPERNHQSNRSPPAIAKYWLCMKPINVLKCVLSISYIKIY